MNSLAAGRWLAEEQYEWGNPEMQYLENLSSTEVKLAKAARKWRVANSGKYSSSTEVIPGGFTKIRKTPMVEFY